MRPIGIVIWNSTSFHLLTFLLFLSGDLQPNPGPDISGLELCSICSEAVLDDHKTICCNLYDSWVHVSCDPSLSDDLYANMIQEPSTNPWFYTMRSQLAPVTVLNSHCTDQLSCACLNVRVYSLNALISLLLFVLFILIFSLLRRLFRWYY